MKINRFLKITFFASLACFASEVLNSQSVYAQTVVTAPQWGGLCLDIANPEGKGPQNGAPVLAFQCHGGENQKWSFGGSTSPSPNSTSSAPIETSSEVVGERYEDMGGGWGGAKATLYRNGLLVIEGRAVSNANTSGTRTTVNVVGVDRRGNALFVSQHLDIPTACGRWDTCPSDRSGRSDQQINPEIAKYVSRLNIHLSDRQGPTVYQNFVRNIREACSSYQELPAGVRQAIASQGGFSGCN